MVTHRFKTKFPESICEECGNEYEPKKGSQRYCSRLCFKKAYLKRKKDEITLNPFPVFNCGCGYSGVLDFNPVRDPKLWEKYTCPKCDKPAFKVSS